MTFTDFDYNLQTIIKISNLILSMDKYKDVNEMSFNGIKNSIVNIINNNTNTSTSNNTNTNNTETGDNNNNENNEISLIEFSFRYYKEENSINLIRNATAVNLLKCKNILINISALKSEDDLYVTQYDFKINNKIVLNTEYAIHIKRNEEAINIDLTPCKNNNILIQLDYPFSSLEMDDNFYNKIKNLWGSGYDPFNSNESFYNDICTPYTPEKKRDITLEDRRNIYYLNYTLCEDNCTYIGPNFETNRSICECVVKTEMDIDRDVNVNYIDNYNSFSKALPKTNLNIAKCYKDFFKIKNLKKNWGFYFQFFFFIISIFLEISYFLYSVKVIRKEVANLVKEHDSKINKKDNSDDISSKKNNSLQKTKSNILKNQNKNNNKIQSSSSFVLDNSASILSHNSKTNIENLNHSKFYKEDLNKENGSIVNDYQNKSVITVIRNEDKQNNITKYKQIDSQVNDKPDEKGIKKKYTIKVKEELNILYWQVLKNHNSIINLIFNRLKFNRKNMKLVYILSSISLTITVNAMLYSESYIHDNYFYLYSINTIKYIIVHQIAKSLLSFLINFVLTIPLNYLCLGYNGLEKMVAHKEAKKSIDYIKEMNKSHNKVVWFCFINFILQLFYLYYTVLFCYVYKNTQTSFFKSSILSIVIGYLASFISALLISILGRLSASTGNRKFKAIMVKVIYGDI